MKGREPRMKWRFYAWCYTSGTGHGVNAAYTGAGSGAGPEYVVDPLGGLHSSGHLVGGGGGGGGLGNELEFGDGYSNGRLLVLLEKA